MSTPMFDVPEHFPIEVDANGQGPVAHDEEAYGLQCWCSAGPLCPIIAAKVYESPREAYKYRHQR